MVGLRSEFKIPMYIKWFEGMGTYRSDGCNQTPTALQQRPLMDRTRHLTYGYGYYRFQPYVTKLQHIYSGTVLIISEKTWNKLTEEQQTVIAEEAEKYCAAQLARNRADVADFYVKMEEKGMEIIEPSAELLAKAKEVGQEIMNDPANDELYGKDVMDRIRAGE